MKREDMRLYIVTDRSWLRDRKLADVTGEILRAGATFLQLREKELSHEEIIAEGRQLKALAARYHVPFVINDDVYAAKELDADGVHVGQSDAACEEARRILGPDKIVGVTANTPELAIAAERAGADYIGVGAVFHTNTKKDARDMSRNTLFAITNSVHIPIVAIGGITEANMDTLAGTGVDGIAVISAVYAAKDPAAAAAILREKSDRIFFRSL